MSCLTSIRPGLTGVPKGAMLSDAGLLTNLQAIEGYFRIDGRIRIARPLYHCAVLVGEFLLALARGVDIVFDNGDFRRSACSKPCSATR